MLFGLNSLVTHGMFELPWLSAVLEGQPTVLIATASRWCGPCDGTVTMFREDEPGHYHPSFPLGLRIGKRRRAPAGP